MADDSSNADRIATRARVISSAKDRAAYLQAACGGDHDLTDRVRALLEVARPTSTLAHPSTITPEILPTLQFQLHEVPSPLDNAVGGNLRAPCQMLEIPGFEILEVIGRGGMGVVYKARQRNLKRLVAIKMILDNAPVDEEGLSRFRTEAEAIARLQHPNIVQIYEVGEHGHQPYIVLEFIDGVTLLEHLRGPPRPYAEITEIVELLARAMHYAHSKGIVHRDLKPGNVLLHRLAKPFGSGDSFPALPQSLSATNGRSGGRISAGLVPKIMDFGLAKQLDVDSELTRTGTVLGTPSYMSPEQAAGNQPIGPSTDIYALGAILYSLLTGSPPFRGKTVLETVLLLQRNEPERPSKARRGVPQDLELICLKCLEKEPSRRYSSAEDLANDLQRFLAGEPVLARRPNHMYRFRKYCNRRPAAALTMMTFAVMLVAGMFGSWWFYRSTRANVLRSIRVYSAG